MATLDINDLLDDVHYVYNSLKEIIVQVTKKFQLKVDSQAEDPEADNSDVSISFPRQFYTTCYAKFTAHSCTEDWDAYYGGLQEAGFAFQLSMNDDVLTMSDLKCVGKLVTEGGGQPEKWNLLTPAQQEECLNDIKTFYEGQSYTIRSNYPAVQTSYYYNMGGTFNFMPTGYNVYDMYFEYDELLGEVTSDHVTAYMAENDIEEDTETGLISYFPGDALKNGSVPYLKGQAFEAVTGNETTAQNWVSTNGAVHNYVKTYTTAGGSFKVYYGDNYIYYVIPTNIQLSYNIFKTVTDDVVSTINRDNPHAPQIVVPTYDENKYGPPPEPGLVSDNQEDGGNYNHAEFTKVYACTSDELDNLYQWMAGGAAGSSGTSPVTVPDNFDPMNRIVGLIGYPMIIDAGVGDQTTFTFRNAANQTINTGWSTYKYANFDRAFDFGTVTIPNWEELENGAPFLDYSATVEIYIPFCGIVGLDPQAVMGCTLSCKMWIDFRTGDCSAVVYTNYGGEDAQHPVAFVSGNCGSAEVVSANAFGAYQGAKAQASHKMSQAIIGGFKDLATSVIGGATTGFTRGAANPSGAGGSAGMRAGAIGSVIGGAMNLGVNLTLQNMDNRYAVQVAKNALGTTISGSFGQQTSWYYMDTPYIKVTWPTPISKDVELYGKTFGVPVHRSGALSEFTGYTVCNNVDVSGIAGATASELAIIKQFLETGVFIKEGGEE